MAEKEISQAVIGRLPRYFRFLGELKDEGVERISSQELSGIMNVTASQIRQDFNNFGGFGQQGYGYNVQHLHTEIGKILGLDRTYNMIILGAGNLGQALANYSKFARWGFKIIVGAGNLGQALANYMNFERRGFIFTGVFDNNPALYGRKIRGIEVRPMEEVADFVEQNNVDIAVLTIPKNSAEEVAERLVSVGIKAIWNFAHVDLKVSKEVQVENVHLSDSLMKLSYMLERYEKESRKTNE